MNRFAGALRARLLIPIPIRLSGNGVGRHAAILLAYLLIGFNTVSSVAAEPDSALTVYHSPFHLAFSPDGKQVAVSDHTAGAVVVIQRQTGHVANRIETGGKPTGIAWSRDGDSVYVADATGASVVHVSLSEGAITRQVTGPKPMDVALLPGRGLLLTSDSAGDSVSLLDLAGREPTRRVAAGREPYSLSVTPDERLAVVANRLPAGDASAPMMSATVTLIDLEKIEVCATVDLPPNSTNVHGVCVSPDGRWAYVVHNLARAQLPTEQIEYGWINANAMTVVDLVQQRRYATVLLDRFNDGAANPFGVAVSPDSSVLWIALSGVHQLGRMDLERLHSLLGQRERRARDPREQERENANEVSTARGSMEYSDTWRLGIDDPTSVELVTSHLPAEYGHGQYLGKVLQRIDLPGNGPRRVAVSPDGALVAVAMYFSGSVLFVDGLTQKVIRTVSLGQQPAMEQARRGEMIFHDANYCFQRWLSCSTCHPDGRADGLNWDLMNDGIGNPKNTRSLLWSFKTPPTMSLGVRANMSVAAAAGFKHLLFQEPDPEELRAVEIYLESMTPETSPRLIDGRLSAKARQGKTIFENPDVGCARCHPAPLYTESPLHDVGTGSQSDESDRFDTPTLVELWRTAPYLHHGRAANLRLLLTEMNPNDRHGRTSHLTDDQVDALIEFLESL
jgi:DNA-binding beta-propeller fold protein YncE